MEASTLNEAVSAKVFRRLIPFLLLCYLIAYLDRVNVGFAKLQMLADLGLSETVYGLGAGIFFIGYVLFEVPANLILMRVGARVWISCILVAWGAISVSTLTVSSATTFYFLRFLLGIAEAGFIPAVLYYIQNWFSSVQRGKATALFLAGIPLSGVIGGPLSGWIMGAFNGAMGFAGWQWLFFLEGLPAVVLGFACYFYLDNDIKSAAWLTDAEKQHLSTLLASEAGQKELHSIRHGLTNGRVWLLSFTYFFFTLGLYGVSFWLPSIIKNSGVSDPVNIGFLSAIPYLAALITMYLVGHNSDRTRERRWHLAVVAIVGAVGLTFSVSQAHNPVLSLVAMTIATMGIITCIPQFYTLLPAILSGAAAAMGIAVANSVGNIAGFISPYLLGYVMDQTGSTAIGVLILAAALVIGAAMVFLNPKHLVNR